MLSSGIYGAFRFDGSSVNLADIRALGLDAPTAPGPAFAIGHDGDMPDAVHSYHADGATTVLVGELYEADALIERLTLARQTPPAALARAALARFGAETPNELYGEWSLQHWEADGRLTLMSSLARRDRIYYALSGSRCAVAPNVLQIGRIPWIDNRLDEAGLLYGLARVELRARKGGRTMFQAVTLLAPGASVVISAAGVRHGRANPLPPQPRYRGSFDDAMAEAESLLHRSLETRLGRTALPGLMLSGGLDSSVLAWHSSRLRGERGLQMLTTVAPPGSGLRDESTFARIVANALGRDVAPVAMGPETNMYRPTDAMLMGRSGPALVNRPWLLESFHRVARELGVTMLFNGSFGELHYTGFTNSDPWHRRWRRTIRHLIPRKAAVEGRVFSPFHVRLTADRMAHLPAEIREDMDRPAALAPAAHRRELWGYMPGLHAAFEQANEFYPGMMRMEHPFRDVRLIRLFAGFPMEFFRREGRERAPARHYLKGRLPDSIRLRPDGPGLGTPDHMVRIKADAPSARTRIPEFRKAGVDEWLDLDWLDAALTRVAANGPANYTDANEVQLTAINAEWLTWWRGLT